MNRVLFIDVTKKEFTIASVNNRKKGLYLGYYLYTEYCDKNDVVISRGALSGLLPGICQCYAVYYNQSINSINYAVISGNLGANLLSLNYESVVIRGTQEEKTTPFTITVEEEKVLFDKTPELKLYDFLQMKNMIECLNRKDGDVFLFTGDFVNSNIFSKIYISSNEIFNGCGLGNIFTNKSIRLIRFLAGKHTENFDIKKEYFSLQKHFNAKNPNGVFSRSCTGCPKHCFSYVISKSKQNIRYVIYSEYINIARQYLDTSFSAEFERLYYLFDIFSIDFMGFLPFLWTICQRSDIYNEIGIDKKEKLDFKDFVMILKNLNIDNNNFYITLRSDINRFINEYNISIKKTGIHYIPIMQTKKEERLNELDFYPSYLFDMKLDEPEKFIVNKSLYEFIGICPNNIDIYDEYWVSKLGEKIDSRFSSIDGIKKYGEVLTRYKYEVENNYGCPKRMLEVNND